MKVSTKRYTKTMLRALEYEITAAVIEVHKHLALDYLSEFIISA